MLSTGPPLRVGGSAARYRGPAPRYRGSAARYRGSAARCRGSAPRYRGSATRCRGSAPRYRGPAPRYRGSASRLMAPPAGLRSSSDLFTSLTETFTCSLSGSFPGLGPTDVAAGILSAVSGSVPDGNQQDLTCLGLTVVGRAVRGALSQKLPPELGWGELLRVVFQDLDLMSQLVQLFGAEDQLMSHLAARTASDAVVYLLTESDTLSPVWQEKCLQTFTSPDPGPELHSCLWSLTEVLKKLLRGTGPGTLGNVVPVFVSSLGVLCSRLLPEGGDPAPSGGPGGTTLCLLMDLLEVLTAAGSACGSGLGIIPTHSPALLRTISCSSQYFVRKRVLLLLKRTLFQKLGEDWSLSSGPAHTDPSSGVCVLARCVSEAVAENWLQTLYVEQDSFFGGTGSIRGGGGRRPDGVMLRAVSLVLLKSTQVEMQRSGAADGGDGTRTVWTRLQSLWGFLRRSADFLRDLAHPCCWVSLLFGEQDDDLMAAASTCLSLFLTFRRSSGLDDGAVLEAACCSGCNPHCHFILLLQSLAFDHSILLDFLISMETCFLEYFVRYLKFLREDGRGFSAACRGIAPSDGLLPGSRGDARSSDGLLPSSHGDARSSDGLLPGSHGDARSSDGLLPGSHGDARSSDGLLPGSRGDARSSDGLLPGSHGDARSSDGLLPGSRGDARSSDGLLPGSHGDARSSDGLLPGSHGDARSSDGLLPGSHGDARSSDGLLPGSRGDARSSDGLLPGSHGDARSSDGLLPGSHGDARSSDGLLPGSRGDARSSDGLLPGSHGDARSSDGLLPGSHGDARSSDGLLPGSHGDARSSDGLLPGFHGDARSSDGLLPGFHGDARSSDGLLPGSHGDARSSDGLLPGSHGDARSSDGLLPGSRGDARSSDGLLPGSRGGIGPEGRSSLGSGLRLVDYDSSEGSGPEDPGESELLKKASWAVLNRNQTQSRTESVDEPPAASPGGSGSIVSGETRDRAVLCLSELRDVVRRLQGKNLFPYNPSSLLRLLSQVDHC